MQQVHANMSRIALKQAELANVRGQTCKGELRQARRPGDGELIGRDSLIRSA